MNDSSKESLKEVGRLMLLGILSYLLTEGVVNSIVAYFVGTRLDAVTISYITGLLTVALRAADKKLHELGKDTGSETLQKGLTQF